MHIYDVQNSALHWNESKDYHLICFADFNYSLLFLIKPCIDNAEDNILSCELPKIKYILFYCLFNRRRRVAVQQLEE